MDPFPFVGHGDVDEVSNRLVKDMISISWCIGMIDDFWVRQMEEYQCLSLCLYGNFINV